MSELIYMNTKFDSREDMLWSILLTDIKAKWEYKPKMFSIKGKTITPTFLTTAHVGRGKYAHSHWLHIDLGCSDDGVKRQLRAVSNHTKIPSALLIKPIGEEKFPLGLRFFPDSPTVSIFHPQVLNRRHPDILIRAITTAIEYQY